MFVTDIVPGTNLTIVLNYEKEVLEFPTTAVRPVQGGLLVEPITQKGMMINFVQKYNILYQLTFVNKADSRLYKWNRIVIRSVRDENDQLYHMIISELEGQPHNRRQSYRVSLELEGIARFGSNRTTHPITIKNISSGGLGFESKANMDCSTDMTIHLSFEDTVLHVSFKVDCQFVRKVFDEENENIYYGCKFLNESMGINNYIQRKQQRLKIKNNPGYKR